MGSVTLSEALALVGLPPGTEAELLPANWHGDRQWRVRGPMSLRVIRGGRSSVLEEENPMGVVTVTRQVAAGEAFRAAGIPFMRLVAGPVIHGEDIVLLYDWIPGAPLPAPATSSAYAVGALLRRLHEIGAGLSPDGLPIHDKATAARITLGRVRDVAPDAFTEQAETVIAKAEGGRPRTAVCHSDLNLPNLLWTGRDDLAGLVDLDQIGVDDPIAELAWVVKWWSRPAGVRDHTTDQALADSVFAGYGADSAERAATAPFLWMSGCLNLHGVEKILASTPAERSQVITQLRDRSDRLGALAG